MGPFIHWSSRSRNHIYGILDHWRRAKCDATVALSVSQIIMLVSYTSDNVTCLTTATTGCVANSTLCLYNEMGHFEDVAASPFMGDQVMGFLARNACSTWLVSVLQVGIMACFIWMP